MELPEFVGVHEVGHLIWYYCTAYDFGWRKSSRRWLNNPGCGGAYVLIECSASRVQSWLDYLRVVREWLGPRACHPRKVISIPQTNRKQWSSTNINFFQFGYFRWASWELPVVAFQYIRGLILPQPCFRSSPIYRGEIPCMLGVGCFNAHCNESDFCEDNHYISCLVSGTYHNYSELCQSYSEMLSNCRSQFSFIWIRRFIHRKWARIRAVRCTG